MEIVWQAHNAVISDRLRSRAETSVEKVARRLGGTVGATVRFEREGTRCRVEVMLRARGHRAIVAEGNGRYYGPALAIAVSHLERQVTSGRRDGKRRATRVGPA